MSLKNTELCPYPKYRIKIKITFIFIFIFNEVKSFQISSLK